MAVRHSAAKTDCVDQRYPCREAGKGTVNMVRRMRRRRDVDAMRVRRALRRPAAAGEDAATAALEGNDARRWRQSKEGQGCVAIVMPAPSLRSVGRFVCCRAAAPVRSGRRIPRQRAAARERGEASDLEGGGRCIVRPVLGRVSQCFAGGYVVQIYLRQTNVGSNNDYITNPTAPALSFLPNKFTANVAEWLD